MTHRVAVGRPVFWDKISRESSISEHSLSGLVSISVIHDRVFIRIKQRHSYEVSHFQE